MRTIPIGIIDSGIGGVSVWREIKILLPQLSTMYVADSKHIPYGEKDEETIFSLSSRLITYLEKREVKLVVVACNTISVVALERLRKAFPHMIFIGTVPVVKTVVKETKTNKIGILSTKTTAKSSYQQHLLKTCAKGCEITVVGTNELVPMVERGEIDTHRLQTILQPFQDAGVDVLALGCTHFPFLKDEIQNIMRNVAIFDSGKAIARQVGRIVEGSNVVSRSDKGGYEFATTGNKEMFEKQIERLLGEKKEAISLSF